MKKSLLIFLSLCTALLVGAQPKRELVQTAYTEIEIDRRQGEEFKVFPMGKYGALCFLEGQLHQQGNKELQLRYYDQELQLKWEKIYMVDYQDMIISEYLDGKYLYFLVGVKNDEYKVMRVNLNDGTMTAIPLSPIKNFMVTHFKVYQGQILTAGKVNNHPLVMIQAYEEVVKPIVLPTVTQLEAELIDVVIDSLHDQIYVVLEKLKPSTPQGIYINQYDWKGGLIENREILFSNEYNMNAYLPMASKTVGEMLLFGTYGLGSDTGTQGVYSMVLAGGRIKANRFYDFGYLENFFHYLPEKRKARYLRKIKSKLNSDKKMRFRYRIFLHKLTVVEDEILFVAETYNPSTEYRNTDLLDPYGYFANRYNRIYSGTLWNPYNYIWRYSAQSRRREMANQVTEYDYQHAFALGFSRSGQLLWDNSFAFQKDTESFDPMEKSQMLLDKDTLVMMQVEEKEIYYKASFQSKYDEELDTLTMTTSTENETYEERAYGGASAWFGHHFISSGVRDIKNPIDREQNRKVYFMARYSYIWSEEAEKENDGEGKE